MLIIPAIDLKDGRCVRLRQGRMDDETVFSNDPVEMAGRWVAEGARRLHVVDLNGAFAGAPVNASVIHAIARAYPDVLLQVGGGIRTEDTIQAYLDAGVHYVILGTKAVNMPHFVGDVCAEFPGHILVGIDAREGRVATDGWSKLSGHDVIDLVQRYQDDGVEAVIYTDIGRDGMMKGVNIEETKRLASAISIPVIASGGIATLDDIRKLCAIADVGVLGAITGRAIYEGTLDLRAAQCLANELDRSGSGAAA
ncbi:MAG: 1-(5-phosphoribosyl)-5-[(5-phosphoribosylamino)methylideneamino]imidazole-4-carboxamide isomerase [Acidiferrobacter sp.]